MERASSSLCRTSRGEPQAAQRLVSGAASARQSRQKLALTKHHALRQIPFPMLPQRAARSRNVRWVDTSAVGEGDQERLVGKHMLQYPAEKVRLVRRLADAVRRQAGSAKEGRKPVRLL